MTDRLLSPAVGDRREVSFPITQRHIAQFRNRIDSRQPCDGQIALLFTELHFEMISLSVFPKARTARYANVGVKLATLRLLFAAPTD